MPYVGREANSFTTVVDVTVSDDLTVTDDATIGGDLAVTGTTTSTGSISTSNDLTISAGGTLDVFNSGDASTDLTALFGADNGGGHGRTNSTVKTTVLGMPHYTNAQEPVGLIVAGSLSSSSFVTIGGGSSVVNAATYVSFNTAANATTTGGTERMRINSDGLVTIGPASTSSQLFVKSTAAALNTIYAESENQGAGHTGLFYSNSAQSGNTMRVYQDGAATGQALYVHTDGNITPVFINRQNQDGALVDLRQGGTQEGTISVSGSTVSYNAFSGSHWSRLSNNSKPDLLRGTVIETIDAMCVWYQLEYTIPQVNYTKDDEDNKNIPSGKKIGDERYGSQPLVVSYNKPDDVNVGDKINYDHNGTTYEATVTKNGDVKHVQCKVSDTADSTRVYGVFLSWDNDDDSVNDMYVTAVGTNLVRVHKDQTISAGDLLVSNGDGTAKKQADDILRSKTIGKALTNIKQETYDDGSYTIPCALYCG